MISEKSYNSTVKKEALYAAWVSNEMLIPPSVKLIIEPTVGGVYELHAKSPDGIFIMSGVFKEVIPNEKLVYSWKWQGTEEESQVVVMFEDHGEGSSLQLVHSGFLTKESFESHDTGWDNYFKGFTEKIN